ncbi:hypothetical protein [Butyrivibrio sp. AC2005]|uniref:hypothetical protein n=1 Tax=Butyrivibrio sp. AC2005 TaxID=1280672 RepID=UPI0003F4F412|nr:hypothetical protein [Butyrivibrio sp. AC2005]
MQIDRQRVREQFASYTRKYDPSDTKIALVFELVYPKSLELAKTQGYLYKMFEFPTRNESMRKALEETRKELGL